MDADLSTPLNEMSRLNDIIIQTNAQIIFGARVLMCNRLIKRSPIRHYLGRILISCLSPFLKQKIYDTQCGAKIFDSKLITDIFRHKFISRWLFDIEIFFRINKIYGINIKMIEEPLYEWVDDGDSRIRLFDFLLIPFSLLIIIWRYRN